MYFGLTFTGTGNRVGYLQEICLVCSNCEILTGLAGSCSRGYVVPSPIQHKASFDVLPIINIHLQVNWLLELTDNPSHA